MNEEDREDTEFERASGRVIKTVMNWSIGFTLTMAFLAAATWGCPHKQSEKKQPRILQMLKK